MYVGQLIVKGYRSLKDVSIRFYPGLNVLVGKNNAGKSNIIRALDMILGEKWPTYADVEEGDFYRSSSQDTPTEQFLIVVKLEGKGFNGELLKNANARAQIFDSKDAPFWNDFHELEKEPEGRGEWYSGEGLANWLANAEEVWFYLLVPQSSGRKERKFSAFVKKANHWYRVHKFGSEFRDALLTTAYVPSFRDPERQLRITRYSWYGKLIKSLYDQRSDEQAKLIQNAQQQLTEAVGQIFQGVTEGLREWLARAILQYGD